MLTVLVAASLLTLSGPPARANFWAPQNAGAGVTLNAVAIPDKNTPSDPDPTRDPQIVVAVGVDGTVVRSDDAAGTWRTVQVPVPPGKASRPDLRDVQFPSANVGYAVGGYSPPAGGFVFKTVDGGATWTLASVIDAVDPNGLWFTDEGTGHVVGGTASRALIYGTDDGGTSWEKTLDFSVSTTTSRLDEVSFFDAQNGVAVGEGPTFVQNTPLTTNSGLVFVTSDGGANWRRQLLFDGQPTANNGREPAFPGPLRGVWTVPGSEGLPESPGVAYAVGDAVFVHSSQGEERRGGLIWKTLDGGKTWQPQAITAPHLRLWDVAFLDASNGHAVGGRTIDGSNTVAFLETTDGGLTWKANLASATAIPSLRGLAYGSAETRFAVGEAGTVLRYDPEASPAQTFIDETQETVTGLVEDAEDVVDDALVPPEPPDAPQPDGDPRCPSWDPMAQTQGEGIKAEAGQLDRPETFAPGWRIDPSVRLLYELENVTVSSGVSRIRVWARDLDTLCLLPNPVVIKDPSPDHSTMAPAVLLTVDEDTHRLFVLYSRRQRNASGIVERGIAVVGPQETGPGEPRRITQLASAPLPLALANVGAQGSAYYPGQPLLGGLSSSKLYLVSDNAPNSSNIQPATGSVLVAQVDAGRLMAGRSDAFDWILPTTCGRTPVGVAAWANVAVVRTGSHVAFVCAQGRLVDESLPGPTGGVMIIDLDDQDQPAGERFFPAPGILQHLSNTLADPVSGRLFMGVKLVQKGGGLGGFDVARGAWYGFLAESGGSQREFSMLALDHATGRLYAGISGNVIVTDGRARDLPQGRTFDVTPVIDDQGKPTPVDWVRRRLFMTAEGPLRRDTIPRESPEGDTDETTVDVPQTEGLTKATFAGGSQGYGMRVRWVDGTRGTTGQDLNGDVAVVGCGSRPLTQLRTLPLPYCPHGTTRELVLAQVSPVELTGSDGLEGQEEGDANADAVGAEHDGAGLSKGTDQDLTVLTDEEPDEFLIPNEAPLMYNPDSREDYENGYNGILDGYREGKLGSEGYQQLNENRRQNATGNRWLYRRAQCRDFGGDSQEIGSKDGVRLFQDGEEAEHQAPIVSSSSTAVCNGLGWLVAGEARFGHTQGLGAPGAPPFVELGSTRSSATSYRDPQRGLVSRVKAEVSGIRLAHPDFGEASIGLLRTVAETQATGRPQSSNGIGAGGIFERHFEDVRIRDKAGKDLLPPCEQCDPEVVAGALNLLFGTRAHFNIPDPDPKAKDGTPEGGQALVIRDFGERVSEQNTNDDSPNRIEVPGLVVTVFADDVRAFGSGTSRYVLQFAGVSAASGYGITCIYGVNEKGSCNKAPLDPPTGDEPPQRRVQQLPVPPETVERPISDAEFIQPGEPEASIVTTLHPAAYSVARSAEPPPSASPGPAGRILRRVIEGFRFLFNSFVDSLRLAGLWLLFSAPLLLYVRRRWLPAPRPQGGK